MVPALSEYQAMVVTMEHNDHERRAAIATTTFSPPLSPLPSLIESFRSELPSPCTVHLSGKRTSTPSSHGGAADHRHRRGDNGPIVATAFSTERHSISLVYRRPSASIDMPNVGDCYRLSVANLPSSSTSVVRDGDDRDSADALNARDDRDDDDDDGGDDDEPRDRRGGNRRRNRCVAHSSLFWEDGGGAVGVEAFATTEDDDRNNDHEVGTVRGIGRSTSEAASSVAATARGTATAASAIDVGEGGIATTDVERAANADSSIPSTKYRLVIREIATTCGVGAMPCFIPLESRPTMVHVAELNIAVDDDDNDNDDENEKDDDIRTNSYDTIPTAIGVYVAFVDDDAPLRLYVSTKESLQRAWKRRTMGGEVGRDDGNSNNYGHDDDDHGPRFALASLDDAEFGSELGRVDEDDDDNDDGMCQPLVLPSPILAMDTIITDDDGKMNRLAISCYDGTIRILTCRLTWTRRRRRNKDEDLRRDFSPKLCVLRCSSFIVDGPVVSLHFGTLSTITSLEEELSSADKEYHHQSLFLVAGSLCGFACLFYESSSFLPTSMCGRSHSESVCQFYGPMTVVDGLFDTRQGGHEDSVTSVHVGCSHICADGELRGRIFIVVGTQGGRVLIFHQREEGIIDLIRIRDKTVAATRERCDLARRIGQIRGQISVLQDEKDGMGIKARELNAVMSEVQRKIDCLTDASRIRIEESITRADTDDVTDDRQCESELAHANESLLSVVEDEGRESRHNNEDHDPITSVGIVKLEMELKAARTELSSLQLSMYGHSCKIAELSSIVDELVCNLGERDEEIARRWEDWQHPRVLRKLHRYEITCERHLPYPIHGITTYAHRDEASGYVNVFVSTRRSFHVFRHHLFS
jgi:hypothetical protein